MSQRGDTLVEVAMSIAILASVVATSFSVANTSMRTGIQARERTEATAIAQQQAERLRATRDVLMEQAPEGNSTFLTTMHGTYSLDQNFISGSPGSYAISKNASCPVRNVLYSTCMTVISYADPANPTVRAGIKATINVSWKSVIGQNDNNISWDYKLVDRRFEPRTCEVVGQC